MTQKHRRTKPSTDVDAWLRARGKLQRVAPEEALGVWQALARGRWSIVEQFDHEGRRYVVARRKTPGAGAWDSLTPRETQVLAVAAQGHAHKMIAHTLGLTLSMVAADLNRAARKVGARSRLELVAMYLASRPGPEGSP